MTLGTILLCGVLLANLDHATSNHREHKVHNIVLYPDKHSWCNITPIKQVVAYPGCSSVEIDNNVCVGTCFSYSIPRTLPSAPGELIKPYCDSCQPSSLIWQNLTLSCKGEDPESSEMQKSVQIITNCSCSTCNMYDDNGGFLPFASSGDGDIVQRHLDGQELMDWMMESPSGTPRLGRKVLNSSTISNANFSESDPIMNERLLILVKQLVGSGENSDEVEEDTEKNGAQRTENQETRFDKVALTELLQEVEGVNHSVNQETLGEFVRQLEERDHIKVDLDRLRQALSHMQHEINKGPMQESPPEVENEQPHHAHSHHTHKHQHEHHQHQHHQHQSLPAEELPRELGGERLDVEPNQLKPAVEGSELSYHDNLVSANGNDADVNMQEEF